MISVMVGSSTGAAGFEGLAGIANGGGGIRVGEVHGGGLDDVVGVVEFDDGMIASLS